MIGNASELVSQTRWSKILNTIDQSWSKFLLPREIGSKVRLHLPVRRRSNNLTVFFFRGGPPAKYGGRQGRSFFPYNSHYPQKRGESSRGTSFQSYQKPGYWPLYTYLSKATKVTSKEQAQKFRRKSDMDIVWQGAQLLVGGRLAHFSKNWEEYGQTKCGFLYFYRVWSISQSFSLQATIS